MWPSEAANLPNGKQVPVSRPEKSRVGSTPNQGVPASPPGACQDPVRGVQAAKQRNVTKTPIFRPNQARVSEVPNRGSAQPIPTASQRVTTVVSASRQSNATPAPPPSQNRARGEPIHRTIGLPSKRLSPNRPSGTLNQENRAQVSTSQAPLAETAGRGNDTNAPTSQVRFADTTSRGNNLQASTSQVRAAEPAGQGNDSQASTSQMRATDTANPEKGIETATSQQDQAAATGAANHQDGVAQDVGNAAAAVATAKPRHRTKGIARPRYSTTRAWTVRRPIETVSSDQAVSTTAAEAADGPSNHDVQPKRSIRIVFPSSLMMLTNPRPTRPLSAMASKPKLLVSASLS